MTPTHNPEFLTLDLLSATRCRTEILTKENLVGAKTVPTAISRTFTSLVKRIRVSIVRTFLSAPGSEGKIGRLGRWGWKNDLSIFLKRSGFTEFRV